MTLIEGDCVEVMAGLPAASVDAVVCDPPYGIRFMGKAWDGAEIEAAAARDRLTRRTLGPHSTSRPGRTEARSSSAFGATASEAGSYDFSRHGTSAFQDWCQTWATEALRVAKPGAYLLAFGGTRTVHRLTCAIEDAGWSIRDVLIWAYASGFPKSRSSLKPSWEPIVLARKPGPLRELNIDGCRIAMTPTDAASIDAKHAGMNVDEYERPPGFSLNLAVKPMPLVKAHAHEAGRWPSNLILTDPIFDGDTEGVVGGGTARSSGEYEAVIRGERSGPASIPLDNGPQYGDSGTYSRFFLIPKSARAEREPVLPSGLPLSDRVLNSGSSGRTFRDGEWVESHSTPRQRVNGHPTVKPLDLMRHLVRLVTPTGGTVLDCFAGSGTTLLAAEMEGFEWIGIEREAEYVAIAEARLAGTQRGLGLDVGAPTPPPSRPTGMEQGHHPNNYARNSPKFGRIYQAWESEQAPLFDDDEVPA